MYSWAERASGNVLGMALPDIEIEDLCIAERGFNLCMAQELLNLINGHSALQGHRRGGVTEDVWRYVHGEIASGDDLLNFILHGL